MRREIEPAVGFGPLGDGLDRAHQVWAGPSVGSLSAVPSVDRGERGVRVAAAEVDRDEDRRAGLERANGFQALFAGDLGAADTAAARA